MATDNAARPSLANFRLTLPQRRPCLPAIIRGFDDYGLVVAIGAGTIVVGTIVRSAAPATTGTSTKPVVIRTAFQTLVVIATAIFRYRAERAPVVPHRVDLQAHFDAVTGQPNYAALDDGAPVVPAPPPIARYG